MAFDSVQSAGVGGASGTLAALVAGDGSASHRFVARLTGAVMPMRDLADVLHQLCLLHARHPDILEQAAAHSNHAQTQAWFARAQSGFAVERAFLIRLVAAAGPLPSTPGQAASEAAVAAQRHALDMLAQSDRAGCADGTALALVLDWPAIRAVLDTAANRMGIVPPESGMPPAADTACVIDALASRLSTERAMLFGTQQMLAQHRGLWDLIEARASARGSN